MQFSLFTSLQVHGKRVTAFTDEEEAAVGYVPILPKHEGLGATCNEASALRLKIPATMLLFIKSLQPLCISPPVQVLAARGATFVAGGAWSCHVCSDSRIFTGQNPMSASAVGAAIVAALAEA